MYKQPLIFDENRRLFLKYPLGGCTPLLDEDFDTVGADAFFDRVDGEIASQGTYARGIDVLPSFMNDLHSILETPAKVIEKPIKETKAAIQQKEWLAQRAVEKARQDEQIRTDWEKVGRQRLKQKYRIAPRDVPAPGSKLLAYRIFNSANEHIGGVFWDRGKFRWPSGLIVERDELGYVAAQENVTLVTPPIKPSTV